MEKRLRIMNQGRIRQLFICQQFPEELYKPIKRNWSFKHKKRPDGTLLKHKARGHTDRPKSDIKKYILSILKFGSSMLV